MALNHVVVLPKWVWVFRIAELVLALLVLGLTAYSASEDIMSLMLPALGVNLFTAAVTLPILVYLVLSPRVAPNLYQIWVVLGLEVFLVVFWLISFAMLGDYSRNFVIVSLDYYIPYWYAKRSLDARSAPGLVPWDTSAAAAGVGGLEFILFIITLVIFSFYLHRHRKARATTNQTEPSTGVMSQAPPPPAMDQKVEPAAVPPTMEQPMYPPQPVYAHQPVYDPQQQQQQSMPPPGGALPVYQPPHSAHLRRPVGQSPNSPAYEHSVMSSPSSEPSQPSSVPMMEQYPNQPPQAADIVHIPEPAQPLQQHPPAPLHQQYDTAPEVMHHGGFAGPRAEV